MPDVEIAARRIARRSRIARESAGLSQEQAARKLGIARSSLTEAESGNRKISAGELAGMAEIYGVAISWLAGLDGSEKGPDTDQIELAARELAGLAPQDLQTVIQLVKSIRAKDR